MYQPFHNSGGLTVHNGDVIDMLAHVEPGSIDAVVTSPPYAMQRASTYGGVREKDYPGWTVAWMNTLKPALAERGSVMLNISPRVKGGMLADYVLHMRLALRADGWYEHDELVWVKPNAFPSGVNGRPLRSWESVLWYSISPRPFSDPLRNGKPNTTKPGMSRAQKSNNTGAMTMSVPPVARCKNYVSVPVGAGTPGKNHPAAFPVPLADWLMKINTPDGGTVLDPFAGSGTTAVAALRNGFQSVAIEREPEYAQMIVDRYRAELAKRNGGLFDAEVAA